MQHNREVTRPSWGHSLTTDRPGRRTCRAALTNHGGLNTIQSGDSLWVPATSDLAVAS
jgi:hypothetical protein